MNIHNQKAPTITETYNNILIKNPKDLTAIDRFKNQLKIPESSYMSKRSRKNPLTLAFKNENWPQARLKTSS